MNKKGMNGNCQKCGKVFRVYNDWLCDECRKEEDKRLDTRLKN